MRAARTDAVLEREDGDHERAVPAQQSTEGRAGQGVNASEVVTDLLKNDIEFVYDERGNAV